MLNGIGTCRYFVENMCGFLLEPTIDVLVMLSFEVFTCVWGVDICTSLIHTVYNSMQIM